MLTVDARNLPRHIAIIMDGNGRWAQARGLPRSAGHERGSDTVRTIVRLCRRLGVEMLTLFAFSEQNWSRPEDEVSTLMDLLQRFLISEKEELLHRGICLRAVGDTARLPEETQNVLHLLEGVTADKSAMTLTLALSYGGREELALAARALAERVARGELRPDQIDAALFRKEVPSCLPLDPDLLIRTGGEHRISNFLLWGAAYAELFFSPTLWPDFGEQDLFAALSAYQARERRFGLTSAQVQLGGDTDAAGVRVPLNPHAPSANDKRLASAPLLLGT